MDFAPIMGPAKFGIDPSGPASNAPTALAAAVSPGADDQSRAKAWSPENPLFAFGALAAITFGLMAFSTSVRVGHTTAALSLGDTK